jgi:hypothetical protein
MTSQPRLLKTNTPVALASLGHAADHIARRIQSRASRARNAGSPPRANPLQRRNGEEDAGQRPRLAHRGCLQGVNPD